MYIWDVVSTVGDGHLGTWLAPSRIKALDAVSMRYTGDKYAELLRRRPWLCTFTVIKRQAPAGEDSAGEDEGSGV